jgi:hypothetical protein
MEETGVPRENHRPIASHWQTLSNNVVSSIPQLSSSNKIHPSAGLSIIEGRSFVFSGYLLHIIRIFIICFYILDKITGCRHWSNFTNHGESI